MPRSKPRIAVVSPFLDKRHGTERCVAEQLEALSEDFEFHVYSTRIDDIDMSKIFWHRVPGIPGPHLLQYLWFFIMNSVWRWLGRFSGRVEFDLIYSPGINCLDTDLIAVHVIFAKFYQPVRNTSDFRTAPLRFWPRLLHRRISYGFFALLEKRVYTNPKLPLVAVSAKTRHDLETLYGRRGNVFEIHNGIDPAKFNPDARVRLRERARGELGYSEDDFVLLLVGNDWNNKGLPCLLEAVRVLSKPQLRILAVGTDDQKLCELSSKQDLSPASVMFHQPRPDAEFFYAAADVYAGPSREDAFGLPPLEAMACGLPVIVSRCAGVSELVEHEVNGCILEKPEDASELARLIHRLCEDEEFRVRLGQNAARIASMFTWRRNADHLRAILNQLLEAKQAQCVPEQARHEA